MQEKAYINVLGTDMTERNVNKSRSTYSTEPRSLYAIRYAWSSVFKHMADFVNIGMKLSTTAETTSIIFRKETSPSVV